jgi:nucleoside-diphosphate-sugar epimerase
MARVLVTGATGFIGAHLVRRLRAHGDQVTCLVRPTSNRAMLESLGVNFALGDVTDADSVTEAVGDHEIVYHLAGLTMALRRAELQRVNVGGMRNVVQACARSARPPVLVAVSSIAAAGPARGYGAPLDEREAPAPISHYGRSKLAGERILAEFADRVPITIVRPPIVYGEGDRASLPLFAGIHRVGVHLSPGLRARPFSFVHAADLSEALVLAATRGQRLRSADDATPAANARGEVDARGIYFAAGEEIVSYGEFGRRIGQALGRPRTLVIPIMAVTVWSVALGSEFVAQARRRPMIFNLDKAREALAGAWVCSTEALHRDTGFRPLKPLDERLAQTAEWYAREGWLPRRLFERGFGVGART